MKIEPVLTLKRWYVERFFKPEEQYQFMLNVSVQESIPVRLMGKKYDGVIIEYTDVDINEDNALSFTMSVIANPNLKQVETKAFKKYTSNILYSIILHALKKEENENRRTDTTQSV